MLMKIEDREIMTAREASLKYEDYYITFVITDIGDGQDNSLGYVIYIYDDEREKRNIPREEKEGKFIGHLVGYAAEKDLFVGGFTFVRKD